LAFIDPEGMADLHWKTVVQLAAVQRMDLIINYPQGGLNRYMCQAFEKKEQTIIDDFFGNRVWRKIYKEWLDKKGFPLHRHLIDLYKQGLKDLGYAEVFRGDEGLEDEPLIRNIVRNAPLYRLLFASKHQRGLEFWHKVTHRNVYGQARLL
jgi:three-Cys-motif partner protein